MKKSTLILFCYTLIVNFLNCINVDQKLFFIVTIGLSIICSVLIERIVIRKINCEAKEDCLTALENKRAYSQNKQFFNSCNSIGVMFLDINNLKITNDTYGHAVGDELIVSVAKVIKKHTVKGVFSYRFGGDEFVIILTNITKKQLLNFKELLIVDFDEINLKESSSGVSVAIGLGYEDNKVDIERVLQDADCDMYEVKKAMKKENKKTV